MTNKPPSLAKPRHVRSEKETKRLATKILVEDDDDEGLARKERKNKSCVNNLRNKFLKQFLKIQKFITHYCAISQIVQECFAGTVWCRAIFQFGLLQPLAYRAGGVAGNLAQ